MKSTRLNKQASTGANILCSPAWLLRGISSIPGELTLTESRISFTAQDPGSAWDWQLRKLALLSGNPAFMDTLKRGTAVVVFNEPLADILVRSPWYYFSGGLVLQIRGKSFRVSFGGPAGSSSASDELRAVSAMRRVGKKWLQALTAE